MRKLCSEELISTFPFLIEKYVKVAIRKLDGGEFTTKLSYEYSNKSWKSFVEENFCMVGVKIVIMIKFNEIKRAGWAWPLLGYIYLIQAENGFFFFTFVYYVMLGLLLTQNDFLTYDIKVL